MKFYNLALAAMALSLTASASADRADMTQKLQDRTVASRAVDGLNSNMRLSDRQVAKHAAPQQMRVIGQGGAGIDFVDSYGTLHEVISEDFSLLTTGSADDPDMTTNLTVDAMELFGNAWYTFDANYTHTPNWGTHNCYPAGGALYMAAISEQAQLNTPLIKLDSYNKVGVLEFKVRTRNAGTTYNDLLIEAAETRNMGPTWDIIEDAAFITGITDQWTTYRLLYRGCGPTTMFNMVMCSPGELLLDDIRVYELEPFVTAPEIKAHTDYEGSSFTAHWLPVEGADHYLFSLYQYDVDMKPVYEVQSEKVDGTSYEVKGVTSGEIYFYSVAAVKDGRTSLDSFEHRVYDLERPVLKPVMITDDHEYRASWESVPGADFYNYWGFNKRVAEADGTFVVTNENFDGITDAEGFETGLTKEDPDYHTYDVYYPMPFHQEGWKATNAMPYDNYLALDAFHYEAAGSDSGLVSPEFDLSKNNGQFTLEADLAGNTSIIEGKSYTTQACVALFNFNEEKGDYEQVELVYPKLPVDEEWCHFKFKLTKGSARSKVGIYAIRSFDNLYVDNLKITQEYKKDEYLIEPFRFAYWHGFFKGDNPLEITVDVPAHASGMDLYHAVSAYGHIVIGQSAYDDRESKLSDVEYVGQVEKYETDGVRGIQLSEVMVNAEGGRLAVANPASLPVSVCGLNGVVIFESNSEEISFSLPAQGIYIVKAGKRSYKIVY